MCLFVFGLFCLCVLSLLLLVVFFLWGGGIIEGEGGREEWEGEGGEGGGRRRGSGGGGGVLYRQNSNSKFMQNACLGSHPPWSTQAQYLMNISCQQYLIHPKM